MSRFSTSASALTVVFVMLSVCAPSTLAQTADPAKVLTRVDVETVLGGSFAPRIPEPGAVFYEEQTKGYRQVNVYLSPADGKTVDSLFEQITSQGETAERVPGVGDAALYRPQYSEVTVEKRNKSGQVQWLAIAVHHAASPEESKRFALELAKRAAARM